MVTNKVIVWLLFSIQETHGDGDETSIVKTDELVEQMNYNWQALERMAPNRARWRELVNGPCSTLEPRA